MTDRIRSHDPRLKRVHGWVWRIAGCIMICYMVSVSAVAQQRPTTRQLEAMSAAEADQFVRRDLLSILQPSGRIDSGGSRAVNRIRLSTQPTGTQFEGVCRRDTVFLEYSTIGKMHEPEERPLRVQGVSAQPWFHIIALPAIDTATGRPEIVWADQPACRTLDDGKNDRDEKSPAWIAAKDAFQAIQGALTIDTALISLRAGTLKPLPCDDKLFDTGTKSCTDAILAIGSWRNIYSITTCPAEPGSICYRIGASLGKEVTIIARADEDHARPSQILSIAIEEFIAL